MIAVYIASPYTIGDQLENVNKSFDVALELIKLGFAPFAPLYSHYLHERQPQHHTTWMALDFEWVRRCDCLLRLPGESSGADAEIEFALIIHKPVFYSVKSLVMEMKKLKGRAL